MNDTVRHFETLRYEENRANLQHPLLAKRIETLAEIVDGWRFRLGVAYQEAKPEGRTELDRWFAGARETICNLDDSLREMTSREQAPRVTDDQERAIVVATFIAIAKAKAAVLAPADTLFADALQHVDPAHKEFFERGGATKIGGWLRRTDVMAQLAAAKVVTFYEPRDSLFRLIDLDWLVAHADRRRFVMQRHEGSRCRLCRISETAYGTRSMQPASRTERTGSMKLDAVGRRIDALAKSGMVHDVCVETWEQWVADAARYLSDAEAEAADRAAGRVSIEAPVAPQAPPEPEPPQRMHDDSWYTTSEARAQVPQPEPSNAPPTVSQRYDAKLQRHRARRGSQ
jgi:hypothetical protein